MAQKEVFYKGGSFLISYSLVGEDKKQTIVILHGWGARKGLMEQVFDGAFKDFKHCYIDLPGFGNSPIPPFALNTQDYAEVVKLLLEALGIDNPVILGHSYGGKVATLLNPRELILLSSAGMPTQKSLPVRTKIACVKFLCRFAFGRKITTLFRSKDVRGMEEVMYQTFKNIVDEDFTPIFKAVHCPCYIFWGREDLATPLSCGEEIHKCIKDSKFFVLEGDHFFFLKHGKDIEAMILGRNGL